ncbi:hypothetical protein ACFQU2_41985 [Siccirubricoccus deserti]
MLTLPARFAAVILCFAPLFFNGAGSTLRCCWSALFWRRAGAR